MLVTLFLINQFDGRLWKTQFSLRYLSANGQTVMKIKLQQVVFKCRVFSAVLFVKRTKTSLQTVFVDLLNVFTSSFVDRTYVL